MGREAKKKGKLKSRNVHRWLGVVAAFPVMWLCVTGILINHAEEFGLNEQRVKSGWLLGHYRQLPEGEARGFRVGSRRLGNWGELIFIDDQLLKELSGQLVGACAYKADIAVATMERVHFYNEEGLHVDTLDEITLPEGEIVAIGVAEDGGAFQVLTTEGSFFYDAELSAFKEALEAGELSGQELNKISDSEKDDLLSALADTAEIPWSRVLLDAHSGKLFDPIGRYVMTLSTLALMALIVSGLRLFPRRKRG